MSIDEHLCQRYGNIILFTSVNIILPVLMNRTELDVA